MCLQFPGVKVVGITTTHGNTSVENVNKNVPRVLNVMDRLDVRFKPVNSYLWKSVFSQREKRLFKGKN